MVKKSEIFSVHSQEFMTKDSLSIVIGYKFHENKSLRIVNRYNKIFISFAMVPVNVGGYQHGLLWFELTNNLFRVGSKF